jgi:hypothetical protein
MIVSTLAPAITARSPNFLIVSSPVRAGLTPSLLPGFKEPETSRQGRVTLAVPAGRLADLRAALELLEPRLGHG